MNILSDIRFALRLLVKNPGSSAMAVLVMAVGTGVAITMFAFVNGVLWSPLGLNEERTLHYLEWAEADKLRNETMIHPLDYGVLKQESESFDKMTVWRWLDQSFYIPSNESFAMQYESARVETDFFELMEQAPLLGRTFVPEDAASGQEDTMVISHSVWLEQFGGNVDAIGKIAMLGGKPYTVVGVMPPRFEFPGTVHIWIASNWQRAREAGRDDWLKLWVVGVLKDGVSPSQAKAELATIAGRLAQEFPETNENLLEVEMMPFVTWYANAVGGESFEKICYILLFCAVLVLGVASANVFNLIMTRIATRTSELSIRNAMGASRAHIVMQVVLDGLILTTLGALGGVLIAGWSLKLLWAKFSQQQYIAGWWHMDLDGSVLGFVIAIVIVSALASSLIPGLRASRSSVAENLKDDSRTSSSLFIGVLSKIILGFQITVTGVLVFVSVMMLLVWVHSKSRELPYEPEMILNGGLHLENDPDDRSVLAQTRALLKERLLASPGIEAIAYTYWEGGGAVLSPGVDIRGNRPFEVDGVVYETDESKPQTKFEVISEGFESVFEVSPLIGRSMSALDTMDSEAVCMVNKTFVDHYWPNENPIGKRIKILGIYDSKGFRTVVGVMPNLMPRPMPGDDLVKRGYVKVYVPIQQTFGYDYHSLIVRANVDPHGLLEPMRRALRAAAPDRAFRGKVLTLKEMNDRYRVSMDLIFAMFGVFGMASLILGVVGLYAIMSFTTKQRFREFGIRMAMGANSKEIVMAVVRRGALLLAIGGLLGVGAGHAISMYLKTTIDVHELPLGYTYPIVVVVLVVATMVSMGVPAWRASRISPNKALRVD